MLWYPPATPEERPSGDVDLVEAPDWLAFSVWAEDACVVVEDVVVEDTEPTRS